MAKVRINRKKLNKLVRDIQTGVGEGIISGIDKHVIPRAKELTPTDTKELIGSFYSKADIGAMKGTVGNSAEHYGFIELGTRHIRNFHKGPPRQQSTIFRTSGEYKGLRGARMTQQAVDEAVAKGLLRREIRIKINGKIF